MVYSSTRFQQWIRTTVYTSPSTSHNGKRPGSVLRAKTLVGQLSGIARRALLIDLNHIVSQPYCQPTIASQSLSANPCQPTIVSQPLSVDHCQSTIVSQSLSANHCQPTIVSQPLSVNHCQPTIVSQPLSVSRCHSDIVTQPLSASHCQSTVVSQPLSGAAENLRCARTVARNKLHCEKPGDECYGRGVPCLLYTSPSPRD